MDRPADATEEEVRRKHDVLPHEWLATGDQIRFWCALLCALATEARQTSLGLR